MSALILFGFGGFFFTGMAGQPETRPQLARTHEESRLESSCACGWKERPGATRGKIIHVTQERAERIKIWAKSEFDTDVLSYSVCAVLA